jgi:hypothetical protein
MNDFVVIYLSCVLGVFISIILPVLRQALPTPPPTKAIGTPPSIYQRIWEQTKPYLVTGLFSLLVSILLVAFLKEQLTDWRAGILAGYAADSTLQKLKG